MNKHKDYKIPIDFSMLPKEEDIDPWTRIEIPSRAWYNYINSLDENSFEFAGPVYDCNYIGDTECTFIVSPNLEIDIKRLKSVKNGKYYLNVAGVVLIDEGNANVFGPHHMKVGKATSRLNFPVKTVMHLLHKCGVSRLMGTNILTLSTGTAMGSTAEELKQYPEPITFSDENMQVWGAVNLF